MAAGFFGKLPAHGDFVERGWPSTAIGAWDNWLQQALTRSREQLGERWLDIYLTSPLWRFGLSAGCVDDNAWLGILLPSVDRVGRYFPLLLGTPLDSACHLLRTFLGAAEWFAAIEQIGLAALEQALQADALEQALNAVAAPPLAFAPSTGHGIFCANSAAPAVDALAELLEWQWRRDEKTVGLWSSSGSSEVRSGLLLTHGLPAAEAFAALLDGRWRHWGWSEGATA